MDDDGSEGRQASNPSGAILSTLAGLHEDIDSLREELNDFRK